MDQTRIEVRGGPTRCPYCHDDVSSGPENVVCRECLARHHPDCWRGACAVCSSSNRLVAEPRPPVTSAAAATPPVARTDRADRTFFATVVVVAGLLGVVMAPSEVSPGLAFLLAPVTGIIAGRLTGQYRWPLLAPLAFSLTFVLLVAKHLSVEDTVVGTIFVVVPLALLAGLLMSFLSAAFIEPARRPAPAPLEIAPSPLPIARPSEPPRVP